MAHILQSLDVVRSVKVADLPIEVSRLLLSENFQQAFVDVNTRLQVQMLYFSPPHVLVFSSPTTLVAYPHVVGCFVCLNDCIAINQSIMVAKEEPSFLFKWCLPTPDHIHVKKMILATILAHVTELAIARKHFGDFNAVVGTTDEETDPLLESGEELEKAIFVGDQLLDWEFNIKKAGHLLRVDTAESMAKEMIDSVLQNNRFDLSPVFQKCWAHAMRSRRSYKKLTVRLAGGIVFDHSRTLFV